MNAITQPASAPGGTALVPTNIADAMRLAEMMAKGKLVPQALQQSPADCLLVIEQATRWGMSPFAVAQEVSVIQGKLMHSGKIVAAAIQSSGVLDGRLRYDYSGSGDARTVVVSGILRGETEPREVSVMVKDAKTNNRVWMTQPDQQLAYHGARVWARRYAPEVMLGVWSPEEMETAPSEPRHVENLAPREPPPAGSMREAAASIQAEERFPVIAPNGSLASIRAAKWVEAVGKAVGNMEDAPALSAWRAAMGPHLASMAEAGHHEMVEEAERLIDLRRDQFAAESVE